MKKTLKFALLAAFAVLSSTSAWAVKSDGDSFTNGNYVFKVKGNPDASYNMKAEITTIKDGKKDAVNVAGTLAIPSTFDYVDPDDGLTYHVSVIGFAETTFKDLTNITGITIPASIESIPQNAFSGCTQVNSITFAANSQVTSIGKNAFGSTVITSFDFSPCVKLAELVNETFVEPGTNNSFITEITLPSQPYFKHINGAFQNLTKLATLNGLENSYVTEIIAEAFKNTLLKNISLPKTVKYIDSNALKTSVVESLTINVRDLEYLGGGKVNTTTYAFSTVGASANLFGTAENETLQSLSLTGTLKGQISKNAFLGCKKLQTADGLENTLDLTTVTLGSKATIESSAFQGCIGIKTLKIGDIANNETSNATIQKEAFKGCTELATVTIGNISTAKAIGEDVFAGCKKLATVTIGNISAANAIANDAFVADKVNYTTADNNKLATVTIGDITATSAIGAASFGKLLKDVTIGSVVANGTAIPANAFVWASVKGTSLNIAQGTGEYISQSSADDTNPAIAANAFDFSAVTGATAWKAAEYPTIKIGAISSKGGAFAKSAITVAATNAKVNLTFMGDIAANGIDKQLLSAAALTAITFNGKIGTAGLGNSSFANQTNIVTFNFAGELAEKAVASGAFDASSLGAETVVIKYTFDGIDDYTVNPFDNKAFSASVNDDTDRFIGLEVTDALLLAEFKNAVYGIGKNDATRTGDKFDIFLVTFPVEVVETDMTFPAYVNNNALSVAWGRYDDFGKFVNTSNPDYVTTLTNGVKVARYAKAKVGDETKDVKVTLYGVYTDEDDNAQLSTVYMVPLKVNKGYYEVTKDNTKTVIVKVESLDGTFTSNTTIHVKFEDAYTNQSVWTELPSPNNFQYSAKVHTHQQLWDKVSGYENVYGSLEATSNMTPYALYIMTDPANYHGFEVRRLTITADNTAYLGNGWYYAKLKSYGKTGEAHARIVWLDEDEATAIFSVKEDAVKTAADKFDGAIYNLQGIRVDTSYKGIVIKNGKKYLQK